MNEPAMDDVEVRRRQGLPLIWDVMDANLVELAKSVDHLRVAAGWGDRQGFLYHWQRVREAFVRADATSKALFTAEDIAPPCVVSNGAFDERGSNE
jgi:hypothetical protein